MCVNPIPAWFTPGGASFWPIAGSEEGSLPCGKCLGCRSRQAMDWSTRIWCESRLHEQNAFLTLTYANAPKTLKSLSKIGSCFLNRFVVVYLLFGILLLLNAASFMVDCIIMPLFLAMIF